LEVRGDGMTAAEVGEQRATFEVRAFGSREWSVRRPGRYEWVHDAAGWQIRPVDVLAEDFQPRDWFGLGR